MNKLWVGMPEFSQIKVKPFVKCSVFIEEDGTELFIRFDSQVDFTEFLHKQPVFTGGSFYFYSRTDLESMTGQKITGKTKSIWFPFKSHWGGVCYNYTGSSPKPRYPIYIVSKGRHESCITSRALNRVSANHYIVCEAHEAEEYKEKNIAEILVLPESYLIEYNTCDNLGESRSKGPGAARNFCLDHALSNGFKRHWVMDDNLDDFYYLNANEKYKVYCSGTIAAAEDFVDRFKNVPVAGMNYASFCKKTDPVPPFVPNTRIYSCLLIDNEAGYRWRGRYNEDTDLSLRVLKDGNCTIQFNAFLCGKVTTQRMRGGNSKEFYDDEGTLPKSKMLEDLHPDVAKVAWKFNRWHHSVDYKKFKNNKLIPNNDTEYRGINNYGLTLTKITNQGE